jgi:hypothetical protein
MGEVLPGADGEGEGVSRTDERARFKLPSINCETSQLLLEYFQHFTSISGVGSPHTVRRFFAFSRILSASLLKIADENSSPGPLPLAADATMLLSGNPAPTFTPSPLPLLLPPSTALELGDVSGAVCGEDAPAEVRPLRALTVELELLLHAALAESCFPGTAN